MDPAVVLDAAKTANWYSHIRVEQITRRLCMTRTDLNVVRPNLSRSIWILCYNTIYLHKTGTLSSTEEAPISNASLERKSVLQAEGGSKKHVT